MTPQLLTEIHESLDWRGWAKGRPADLAKSATIEGAELLEVFQRTNPTREEANADPATVEKVKEELADVLIYCAQIAHAFGLDPEAIVRAKVEKNGKRYPVELVTGPDGRETCYRIKAEKRAREGA